MHRRPTFGSLNRPSVLLLAGGLLLAINVNLPKAGMQAGLAPTQIAFAASLGARLLLSSLCMASGGRARARHPFGAYVALGAISYAFPAVMSAVIADRVGAGFASVLVALSPVLTCAIAVPAGLQTLRSSNAAGLALGLAGTFVLVSPGIALPSGGDAPWMIAGLSIPAALVTGNILRSLMVPEKARTETVAAGVLLAAACLLAPLALSAPTAALAAAEGTGILLACTAVTAVFNVMLFRLQKAAGPVRLSQIGYVAAAFGVALAALVFGEVPSPTLLAATGAVAIGVRLVNGPSPAASSAPALVSSGSGRA